MTLRALVVDDEAPARRRLRDLIADEPEIELVGECEDGSAAVEAILGLEPDVVFLDVQMPEMDGFEVLDTVGVDAVPSVVFVTAWDRHALAAFEARAVDYLLKPFTRERFRETLSRLTPERDARLEALGRLLTDRRTRPGRLAVKEDDRIHFVEIREIEWIEGDGNYVRLHTPAGEHRVRGTLKGLVTRLGPRGFVRIHHSYLVNVGRVEELRPWSHGELVVVLRSGKTLVSSRTYTPVLKRVLGISDP